MHNAILNKILGKHRLLLLVSISISSVFYLLLISISTKPIQDDYATLSMLSKYGFIEFLIVHWQTHGGNIWPLALHSLAVYSALNSFSFITLTLFGICTALIIVLTVVIFANNFMILERTDKKPMVLFLIFGTLLGFEGMFTPGIVGAFQFSSASLVHLWPVLFFVIGISLSQLSKERKSLLFVIGFISGNSNITESAAFLLTILIIMWVYKIRFNTIKRRNTFSLFIGILLGTVLILSSKGFWTRANSGAHNGLPNSFMSFIIDLLRSLLYFSADVLSHPMVYVFFLVGIIYARKVKEIFSSQNFLPYLEVLTISLFMFLVLGASFAYPSWHQSLGLLLLLPCFFLRLGSWFASRTKLFSVRTTSVLLLLMLGVILVSLIRPLVLTLNRSTEWENSNNTNICLIKERKLSALANPELRYPPLNLGIEEVQSWEWILNAYQYWIENNAASNNIKC